MSDTTNLVSMDEIDAVRKVVSKNHKYRNIGEITVGIEDAVNKMLRAGMDVEEIARILGMSKNELLKWI